MDNNNLNQSQGTPENFTQNAAQQANVGNLAGTANAAAGTAGVGAKVGLAAAWTVKTIITAAVALVVTAAVAIGGYAVAKNYVIFPGFAEALANTMEAKSEPLTEFDTKEFREQGKTEISLAIPETEIEGSFSISHSKKALQAALETCGEKFTVSYSDMNIAVASEEFKNGQAYGLSLKNLRREIMKSVFAANSGTDYEIDMKTINAICDAVELVTERGETTEEMQDFVDFLGEVAKDSALRDNTKISYSKTEVLGAERSGRNQTLTIDKDVIVAVIEDYAEAFEEADGKDLEAIKSFIETLEEIYPAIDVDNEDIAEALHTLAFAVDDLEVLDNFKVTITVVYVQQYVSAIVVRCDAKIMQDAVGGVSRPNFDYDDNGPTNNDEDEEEEAKAIFKGDVVLTVDFGAKPHKTHAITVSALVEGEINGEKGSAEVLIEADSVKKGEVITTTAELSITAKIKKETVLDESLIIEVVFDNKEEEAYATMSASSGLLGKITGRYPESTEGSEENENKNKRVELFRFDFEYSDSREKLSIKPVKVKFGEKEIEIPVDLTLTLYRKPDKIKANKYVDILDMKEKEVDKLVEDLEKYVEELGEKLMDMGSDMGDMPEIDTGILEDVFDDLFDSGSVEDFPIVTPSPDYSYPTYGDNTDDWNDN